QRHRGTETKERGTIITSSLPVLCALCASVVTVPSSPALARAGDLGVDLAAADGGALEGGDDALRLALRHLHERVGVEEVDGADGVDGDARLVGGGAEEVGGPHAVLAPVVEEGAGLSVRWSGEGARRCLIVVGLMLGAL